MGANIKIDCSKMSNLDKMLLGSSVIDDLIAHFNNPENQKKFKEWKKEREKKLKSAEKNSEDIKAELKEKETLKDEKASLETV